MTNIYDFVTEQKTAYNKPISVSDGWDWGMKDHLKRSFLYKNSQFEKDNENRDKRPFKNIVRPILNIQYRTEGFDVKDIEIYVSNPEEYYKSFLVKKYHDKWALENEIDTFIDDIVESYVDYGGVLVRDLNENRPEVIDLRTIAFCDQTDILAGAFAIKHNLSPQQLREQKYWGDAKKGATIDTETLITLCEKEKSTNELSEKKNPTPGKYIEIYELHGTFPDNWLNKDDKEEGKYTQQIHIIAFYKDQSGKENGVSLFASREPKLPFKFLARDKVSGRALGFGGVEELFESQVWTNYSEIQIREMLELASKTFYKTTDPRFKTRNQLINGNNGQVFDLQEGKDISQIDTTPRNLVIFENALVKWEQHAQRLGAAGEALMGESPSSGTPFKLQELVTMEAKSLHHWRQGKIATFMDEIYRDWVIPHIKREIVKGEKFLTELSADELQEISERVVENTVNNFVKERILNGELVSKEEVETMKQESLTRFVKGGRKRFIEILKDEFRDTDLDVQTNIIGKQKRLNEITDKLVNFVRQVIATPNLKQDPDLVRMVNSILEFSGLSPITYGLNGVSTNSQGTGGTESLKELGKIVKKSVSIGA